MHLKFFLWQLETIGLLSRAEKQKYLSFICKVFFKVKLLNVYQLKIVLSFEMQLHC